MLEQYKISDFIGWHKSQALKLRPDFQRGLVWTPAARSYLVDTILRDYPVPKIYLRSRVDVETQKTVREVVDGQQRLSAILAFADNKMRVSTRSSEFYGRTYGTLSEEEKGQFLSYPLAVDQLVNADDAKVLEVFARINTYTVSLNAPEKRHAKFHGEFKAAVRDMSRTWDGLLARVFSVRDRVRMKNDSLVAEMFGFVMEGLQNGGEPAINKLYGKHDADGAPEQPRKKAVRIVDSTLGFIQNNLAEDFANTPLMRPPHFLMLFAALAHCGHGIPKGALDAPPASRKKFPARSPAIMDELGLLASAIDEEPQSDDLREFWKASKGTTQRMPSRKVRFHRFLRALNA